MYVVLLPVLPQHDTAERWTKPGDPGPAGAHDSCHLSRRVTRDLWAISLEHHACVNVSRTRFIRPGEFARNDFPHDDSVAVNIACKRSTLRFKYLIESVRKKTMPREEICWRNEGGSLDRNFARVIYPHEG